MCNCNANLYKFYANPIDFVYLKHQYFVQVSHFYLTEILFTL